MLVPTRTLLGWTPVTGVVTYFLPSQKPADLEVGRAVFCVMPFLAVISSFVERAVDWGDALGDRPAGEGSGVKRTGVLLPPEEIYPAIRPLSAMSVAVMDPTPGFDRRVFKSYTSPCEYKPDAFTKSPLLFIDGPVIPSETGNDVTTPFSSFHKLKLF